MKQKLTDNGFIGNGDKALFSVFDLINEGKGISSVSVKLQENRIYLFNNVKHNYTAIDLFKLNSMPCFGAKVVYCWINQYKKVGSFFIKADKLLSVLDVDTSDSCNLGVRFKRMIKALRSIGYEVEIIKEKKGLDARRISALRFNFKEIKQDARRISALRFNFKGIKQDATKENNPTTPPKVKQDNPMISEVKTNQSETPTPFKGNDALIRFKDSIKTNQSETPTPFKGNDALIRFKNSIKTLNDSIKTLNDSIKTLNDSIKTNQSETPTPFKGNDALTRFKNSIKTLNDSTKTSSPTK